MLAVISAIAGAVSAAFAVYAFMHRKLRKAETAAAVGSAALAAERERIADMTRHYENVLARGEASFRTLAQRILEERSEKLRTEGTEHLKGIVAPLLENIRDFRKKIEEGDVLTAERNTEMKARIENLVAQTNAVTAQANSLAAAIRGDSRSAGEWGEIQLKRVLELSGVAETVDFSYQETFEDATGRKSKRTDVVVKMPGGRSLIIDSKATVDAALAYRDAETAEERKAFRDRLVDSVRKHVDEIVTADYPSAVPGSFPIVLMYIPLEEVYLIAMKAQISVGGAREPLRDYAFRKNVVFVNAAGVIPLVRLVEMMWSVERSEKNRQEMARAAEELLARTNAFLKDFAEVGDAFETVKARYEAARNVLVDAPGGHSIAKAAAKLIKLGVKPKTKGGKEYRPVPEITDATGDEP